MKMTLVVDTDDPKGIDAAWQMIAILQKKAGHATPSPLKKEFGKIEYIKQMRKYVREQVDALNDPNNESVESAEDMYRLRNTKMFADRIFRDEKW